MVLAGVASPYLKRNYALDFGELGKFLAGRVEPLSRASLVAYWAHLLERDLSASASNVQLSATPSRSSSCTAAPPSRPPSATSGPNRRVRWPLMTGGACLLRSAASTSDRAIMAGMDVLKIVVVTSHSERTTSGLSP